MMSTPLSFTGSKSFEGNMAKEMYAKAKKLELFKDAEDLL